MIPVSATAENADKSAGCCLTKCAQDLFQCVRLMGIVDQNMVVSVRWDRFQASLNTVGGGERLRARGRRDSF